jgi:hypothetical protein
MALSAAAASDSASAVSEDWYAVTILYLDGLRLSSLGSGGSIIPSTSTSTSSSTSASAAATGVLDDDAWFDRFPALTHLYLQRNALKRITGLGRPPPPPPPKGKGVDTKSAASKKDEEEEGPSAPALRFLVLADNQVLLLGFALHHAES